MSWKDNRRLGHFPRQILGVKKHMQKNLLVFEGLISQVVRASEGDSRDWQAMHAWAQEPRQHGFSGPQVQ